MAEIDKTYTDDYLEYKKFKDWADKQTIKFFDGHKKVVGNWVWDYKKEDFDNGEIPIMNTPIWVDIFLIQNCKIDFVLNRMKDVYEEEYEILKNVNLTAKPPKNFKRNRKIVIDNNENTKFPIHSKPYGGKGLWLLQCNDDFRYNTTTKRWVYKYSYYPYNTNIAGITSIKALVKHLKKQYLPKNIKFTINGRYVGEEYLVKIL